MSSLLDRQREYTDWLEKGFPERELPGLPLVSACAFAGNASQENLVRPVTIGAKDHGSDGVLQWRLDRLDGPRGLKGWAKSIGWPWDTLKTQAAFTLWELYNDPRYALLAKDLRDGKKKIDTLTANICWIYERPAKSAAHLDKRISHAKSVFKILSEERSASPAAKTAAGAVIAAGAAGATVASQSSSTAALVIAGVCAAVALVIFLASKNSRPKPAATATDHAPREPEFGAAEIVAALQAQTRAIDRLAEVVADLRAQRPPPPAPIGGGWPQAKAVSNG